MRALWLGAGVLALASWSAHAAAPQPQQHDVDTDGAIPPAALLTRAARASRTTNFEGVLVYRSGGVMEVLHVTHRFEGGKQSEHLVTMTGTPRELIRDGNRVTCVLPRGHQVSLQQPQAKSFLTRLDGPTLAKVGKWYEFLAMKAGRVAGRDCLGVRVKPKDNYRYGYRVWLDKLTGLPLRVMLLGKDARVLEQVMFTQVAFPKHIPDSAFQPEFAASQHYKVVHKRLASEDKPVGATATADEGAALWRFSALPPGFNVTVRDQRQMPGGVGLVRHVMVSDGLSSVSVFSARATPKQPGLVGLSHVGAVHAYGRALDGYHITVVGEAPARTVQMIGNALRPVAARSIESPATVSAMGAASTP